ncbi:hypothetical protein STANM309S_02381 [Streptomyces tanashiensis]
MEPGPGGEGLGGGGEHGNGPPGRVEDRPGFVVGAEGGGAPGARGALEGARFGGERGARPEARRQRLDEGERGVAGPLAQEAVGGAALPEGSDAVADDEGEATPGGVVELVDGAEPWPAVGAGGGGDERGAFAGVVQAVDLDVAERAGLLAGLAELLDHAVPDDHRGAGVHEELDVGPAAGGGAQDRGEDAGRGAALGRGLLVEGALAGARRGGRVPPQRAQRLLEAEESGQGVGAGCAYGQGGAPSRTAAGAAAHSVRRGGSAAHVEGDGLPASGTPGRALGRARRHLLAIGRISPLVGGRGGLRAPVVRAGGRLRSRGFRFRQPLGQPERVRDRLGGRVRPARPQSAGQLLQRHPVRPVHPVITSADRVAA